jgi:hypothetical protein
MDRVQRRELKLKVLLTPDEIAAVDDFRVKQRMPSRAAAARVLIQRGMQSHSTTRTKGMMPANSMSAAR